MASQTAAAASGSPAAPVNGPTAASRPASVPDTVPAARRWLSSRAAAVALAIGLAVTAALALTSLTVYHRNEDRLLNLRLRELDLVLAATAPAIQTPLASAAELAKATGGSPQKFRAFMATYVGAGRQFASASLWRVRNGSPVRIATVGPPGVLASRPAQERQFFTQVRRPGELNLTGILDAGTPTLGFEFTPPSGGTPGFVVYAENPLPKNRRSTLERNTAFSDLDYAVYLGHSRRTSDVLVTSFKQLPVTGRQASGVVPFGASAFTMVVAAKGSLGGTFFHRLPWIIVLVGVLLSLAAALMTYRLALRRQQAEQLAHTLDQVAAENEHLYAEQRSIAQTLQHALLPDTMPELAGLKLEALYVPAASGVDIGGDWYDVVPVDDRRVLVLIGDVSGHGLRAATTMALLRHAALAYVAQDPHPATVLTKLTEFVNSGEHDYFATVLCALIDIDGHELTISSAGHIPPLLLDGEGARFVELDPDAPIGVSGREQYREATTAVAAHATLIAFTDGLVERRGEVIDVGLGRLRDLAISERSALGDLLSKLASELASQEHRDDTAIVGIEWQS